MTVLALADLHDAAAQADVPWTLMLDEFGAVIKMAANRAVAILQRGRSHGGQVIVVTQSVADPEALSGQPGLLASLTDNFSGVVAHRQTAPESRDWLAKLMGTRALWQSTNQTTGHGSQHSGRGSARRVREFRIGSDTFAELGQGEAIIYTTLGPEPRRTTIVPVALHAREPERIGTGGRHACEVRVHPEVSSAGDWLGRRRREHSHRPRSRKRGTVSSCAHRRGPTSPRGYVAGPVSDLSTRSREAALERARKVAGRRRSPATQRPQGRTIQPKIVAVKRDEHGWRGSPRRAAGAASRSSRQPRYMRTSVPMSAIPPRARGRYVRRRSAASSPATSESSRNAAASAVGEVPANAAANPGGRAVEALPQLRGPGRVHPGCELGRQRRTRPRSSASASQARPAAASSNAAGLLGRRDPRAPSVALETRRPEARARARRARIPSSVRPTSSARRSSRPQPPSPTRSGLVIREESRSRAGSAARGDGRRLASRAGCSPARRASGRPRSGGSARTARRRGALCSLPSLIHSRTVGSVTPKSLATSATLSNRSSLSAISRIDLGRLTTFQPLLSYTPSRGCRQHLVTTSTSSRRAGRSAKGAGRPLPAPRNRPARPSRRSKHVTCCATSSRTRRLQILIPFPLTAPTGKRRRVGANGSTRADAPADAANFEAASGGRRDRRTRTPRPSRQRGDRRTSSKREPATETQRHRESLTRRRTPETSRAPTHHPSKKSARDAVQTASDLADRGVCRPARRSRARNLTQPEGWTSPRQRL